MLKRSLKGWGKLVRKVPWSPVTHELASLIAVTLVKSGHADMAVAVMLSFSSLLRISECFALKVKDVAFRGDARLGSLAQRFPASLYLRQTKTGADFWAQVQHHDVTELLQQHLHTRKGPDSMLFSFKKDAFRSRFKQAVRACGIPFRLVPHGLRHGGATDAFARGVRLDDILLLGRWAVMSSARHYIQFGAALLMDNMLDPALAAVANLFASRLVESFALAALSATALRSQGRRRR